MWNKIRISAGLMILASMTVWFISGGIHAGGTTPGTVNDPLITKSYVDMKIEDLRDDLTELFESGAPSVSEPISAGDTELDMDDIMDYIDDQIADLDLSPSDTEGGEDATSSENMLFQVIRASNGQRLICGASAEIILRAGEATVIAGEYGDGLADLTSGNDLQGGDDVPANHHLLVSRDDGRGFLITQEAGFSYILVKGDYVLE